jgi:tRNA threonylcarbamoyl adenosine modification protein YeaZ
MGIRLALDTAGSEHAMVLLDQDRLLAETTWPRSRGGGDPPILTRLQALMDQAGAARTELEAVAVGRGPGSFTGLRVGLSVASGVAYGRGIPLYLIDSLAILLAQSARAGAALRDAGRGEAYAWRPGHDPVRLNGEALAAWLGADEPAIVDPPGRLRDWVADGVEVRVEDRRPFARALAAVAIEVFGLKKPVRYHEVQPLYVQPAAAEERAGSQ